MENPSSLTIVNWLPYSPECGRCQAAPGLNMQGLLFAMEVHGSPSTVNPSA
jgi:hypothetical protein